MHQRLHSCGEDQHIVTEAADPPATNGGQRDLWRVPPDAVEVSDADLPGSELLPPWVSFIADADSDTDSAEPALHLEEVAAILSAQAASVASTASGSEEPSALEVSTPEQLERSLAPDVADRPPVAPEQPQPRGAWTPRILLLLLGCSFAAGLVAARIEVVRDIVGPPLSGPSSSAITPTVNDSVHIVTGGPAGCPMYVADSATAAPTPPASGCFFVR